MRVARRQREPVGVPDGRHHTNLETDVQVTNELAQHGHLLRVLLPKIHGIRIDEALFLGGRSKGEFLKTFGADIFFDDQHVHVESAQAHVATAHVPSGVTNE